MSSFKSLALTPPPSPVRSPDTLLVSDRLMPSTIALLRQGKKSISDYVQKEFPARLAQWNLAGFAHKPRSPQRLAR